MVHAAYTVDSQLVSCSLSGAQPGLCNGLLAPVRKGHVESGGYIQGQRVGRWAWLYFGLVMVNFMRLLGWATVPGYGVDHYSECFCKGVFGGDLHLSWWNLNEADCPPKWGGGLIKSIKGLNRTKD